MNLTASNIKYLLALGELTREGGGVRCVDVARHLGVARPSALRALEYLQSIGYFIKSPEGCWSLTGLGRSIAQKYQRYYQDVGNMFVRLLPAQVDQPSLILSVLSQVPMEEMEGVCRKIRAAAGEPL